MCSQIFWLNVYRRARLLESAAQTHWLPQHNFAKPEGKTSD